MVVLACACLLQAHERYLGLKKQITAMKKERDACTPNKAGRARKKELKKEIKQLEVECAAIRSK